MSIKKDHYAIVMGVDNTPPLMGASSTSSDAQAFVDWLASPEGGCLPQENIRHFLLDVTCQKWQFDRAMRNLGIESGKRVGSRLYFYFAGYSWDYTNDNFLLLMSTATSDDPSHYVDFNAYRNYLKMAAPFDEVIYILDTQNITGSPPDVGNFAPPFTLHSITLQPHPVKEWLLINAVTPPVTPFREPGLLTRALLETLRSAEANPDERRSASSLSSRIGDRVHALAKEQKTDKRQHLRLEPTPDIYFDTKAEAVSEGTLIVEVAYWTVEVQIYDNLSKVVNAGQVKKRHPNSNLWQSETVLPKGIYQVICVLGGKTESQYALVHGNKICRIKLSNWKTNLTITSTAPIENVHTTHKAQVIQAEKQSLAPTWSNAPGGDSRLFLFVRTEHPKQGSSFAESLQLLNEKNELVTDFSSAVNQNSRGGWMAFTADLAPGGYILRRRRRGMRMRQQVIYLCAQWETHVFMLARRNYPSFSSMTQNMVPLGRGFQAKQESTIAAEAVLGILRKTHPISILTTDMVRPLISEKLDNPWLGIIAAYAILRAGQEANTELISLLLKILDFLRATIGDHPDVRALHLNDDQKAEQPFLYPPVLRDGLRRVQQHSINHLDTVPPDSPTDVILDNLISDSTWTAWHELDRIPIYPSATRTPRTKKKMSSSAIKQSSSAETPTPIYSKVPLQSTSAKSPIYRFVTSPPYEQYEADSPPITNPIDISTNPTDTPYEWALFKEVYTLTSLSDLANLPESTTVNLDNEIQGLVATIKPEEVSQASGVSLARTQRSLEDLRVKTTSKLPSEIPLETPLSQDEQLVFKYAVQQAVQPSEPTVNLPPLEADFSLTSSASLSTSSSKSIEEMVPILQTEADRLLLKDPSRNEAQVLSSRLRSAAERLLHNANYVIVTDINSQILYTNGAFLLLISPKPIKANAPDAKQKNEIERQLNNDLQANRQTWETHLRSLPPSATMFTNPLVPAEPEMTFRTTVIRDEYSGKQTYLYVFRYADGAIMTTEQLKKMSDLVVDLNYYASFYAYGSLKTTDLYLNKLKDVIEQIEAVFLST